MKTAILTLHYGFNYGAILQAHAMAKLFDGEIVDHRYKAKVDANSRLHDGLSFLSDDIERLLPLTPRAFYAKDCADSKTLRYVEKHFDRLVLGSDELWKTSYSSRNPRQDLVREILRHPFLTLRHYRHKQQNPLSSPFPNVYWPLVSLPVISCAASIGSTDVSAIPDFHLRIMARSLNRLERIGVRDHKTMDFVCSVAPSSRNRVFHTPDPVFTLDPAVSRGALPSLRRKLAARGVDATTRFVLKHIGGKIPKHLADDCLREQFPIICPNETRMTVMEWHAAISLAHVVITDRMHALIVAITHNTPCISIDSRNKTLELKAEYEIPNYRSVKECVDNWAVSAARVEDYRNRTEGFARTHISARH